MLISTILLVTGCLPAQAADAKWVRPPTASQQRQTPGLVHETFESSFMKTAVGYSVVLPKSYSSTKQKRYPVVYWLHGGGGNESSSLYTSLAWNELYAGDQVQEVILVYPNGYRSGYMDHHDGKIMVESMVIKELVPRIDKKYRTIAGREGRAVHGFSMGASGCLKFAIKYPDMFCSAVAYGGGAINLSKTKSKFVLDILAKNLNSDPELIRQNNSYHFLEQNHESLKKLGTQFFLVCGEKDSWKESAVRFQEALHAKGLPCRLKLVPNVAHNLRGIFKAEGKAAARFQDKVFADLGSDRDKE